MDKQLIEEVTKNIKQLLLQFKSEEVGNRLSQFSVAALEQFVMQELARLNNGDN